MGASAQAESLEISGLTANSREVAPGYLFAALPGSRTDGRAFIDEAVENGAVAVLAPRGTRLKDYGRPVVLLEDDNPRRRLALLAARYYDAQPDLVAAVTGTNGKTSVAEFTRQTWQLLGHRSVSLGTLGLTPTHASAPQSLTTPDPIELHHCLAALAADGVERLVMEASSHGLDQWRLDGVRISAAAFTNLTRDHLDYHGDMATYLAAKQRLFTELLESGGTAVLNADDESIGLLEQIAMARGLRVISYGSAGRDLRLWEVRATPAGMEVTFGLFCQKHRVILPLAGAFQAHNVLAALGLAIGTGADPEAALATLTELRGVPGRLERIGPTPSGAQV